MAATNYRVKALIRDIRRRWRRRALLQGAALSLLTLALWGSALLVLYTAFAVPPPYLAAGAVLGGLVLLGVVVQYVVRPGLRRLSDRQIALFVEERIPGLEDRLNSAVEIDDAAAARRAHGALVDRLIDDAADRARTLPITTVVDRKQQQLLTGGSVAVALLFAVLLVTSLDDLRVSFTGADLTAFAPAPQPLMTVRPGDVEIEKGASQDVIVELREDTDRDVVLHYRVGEGTWQKATMQKGVDAPAFLHEFFDVQEPIQYVAEYDQQRSEPFTISLYEFPKVEQVDVTYTYPAYTGLPARTEENTGDVRGLKGSAVTLTVRATGAVETAEVVLDDERTLPLAPAGDGRYRAHFALETPGYYYVRLVDARQKQNKFPEEYRIVPVEDEPPHVTLTDPQRDVRANAIEEVLVAASTTDDFGVKDVRLRFSVNGEAEETISLMTEASDRPTEVEGDHLFFLEDYDLAPGDVISYYVEAEDHFHAGTEATDMYFIEVIPFDQRFSQVDAGGMPGGGQPSGIVMSQQQIIAATWKLHRQRADMDEEAYADDVKGLVQAQASLKGNIEGRISSTAFSLELQTDEDNRQIVAHLRAAVQDMEEALEELEAGRLEAALTPERKALNDLLKADALNKERQVALNRQQGGGGGGGATEERMTELMDLELDISKDKYEVQQPSSAQPGQEVDETLQRLRELARRQQNLANQSQRALEGEDRKRHVERLKRDQDELRRQAESLARSMRESARESDQLDDEMEQRLERIARDMQEAEKALRDGDTQRARTRQEQALNELERLEQRLRMASNENRREMLDEMAENFEQLREQERQLGRDVERAAEEARSSGGRPDPEALARLREKRQALRERLQRLDRQAEAVEDRGRQDDADLAAAARGVRQRIEHEELDEQMRDSEEALARGWLDRARRLEEDLDESLQRLEDEMQAFEGNLPVTEEERLARALDAVRDLNRELQEMQRGQQAQGPQQPSQQGQQSPQGQQPGQQQGQQSPQGQQQGQASADGRGGGGDRQERADAVRHQRRMQQAREALERLREELADNQPAGQALEQLRLSLSRADHTGQRLEGEAADAFFENEIFAPLSQLEQALTRQLDDIAMEKKLYGSRRGDVPAEYRDLVEKYYESLSKGRNE